MSLQQSNLPVGGGVVLAVGLYALASVLVGQGIGQRMIDKSGWSVNCPDQLEARVAPVPKTTRRVPKRECSNVFGWIDPSLNQLCHQFGNPDFNADAARIEREARERAKALHQQQLNKIRGAAGSRCDCATTTYLQDNWLQLGLYAGSARQIALSSVSGMEGELRQSVNAPHCAGIEGGRS